MGYRVILFCCQGATKQSNLLRTPAELAIHLKYVDCHHKWVSLKCIFANGEARGLGGEAVSLVTKLQYSSLG